MSAADASGERPALTPEQRERVEHAVRQVCAEREHRETARVVAVFALEERSKQRRALLVAAVAAIVGAATVIVALVCLAVLALRLAGGVR